uniref:Uncharacterized protein n=1 Tax=Populus trichocarpa TaxID=3694 RepID=A0A3N7G4N8_POPTR
MLVTLPDWSQLIPNQLQGLSPAQEDRRDWLWLSRLTFHSRRASASFLPFATSAAPVLAE